MSLIYVLILIIISTYICTRVHLYTIAICTDGAIMDMCPFVLLAAIWGCISLMIYIYVDIL